MKIIWQGSDSLFLVRFPQQLKRTKIFYVLALRAFAWLSKLFVQQNYACGSLVESNLQKFGLKKIVRFEDRLSYPDKITKVPHEGFNVLYYYPAKDTKFNRWLYGYNEFIDIITALSPIVDIHFIVVDGSHDLSKIYPEIDLLIRPCNHDGHPRMVDECKLNDIPYIWTAQNPDAMTFVEQILREYGKIFK